MGLRMLKAYEHMCMYPRVPVQGAPPQLPLHCLLCRTEALAHGDHSQLLAPDGPSARVLPLPGAAAVIVVHRPDGQPLHQAAACTALSRASVGYLPLRLWRVRALETVGGSRSHGAAPVCRAPPCAQAGCRPRRTPHHALAMERSSLEGAAPRGSRRGHAHAVGRPLGYSILVSEARDHRTEQSRSKAAKPQETRTFCSKFVGVVLVWGVGKNA